MNNKPKIGDRLVINSKILYKFSRDKLHGDYERPAIMIQKGDEFIVVDKLKKTSNFDKTYSYHLMILLHAKTLQKLEFQDDKYNWELFEVLE